MHPRMRMLRTEASLRSSGQSIGSSLQILSLHVARLWNNLSKIEWVSFLSTQRLFLRAKIVSALAAGALRASVVGLGARGSGGP